MAEPENPNAAEPEDTDPGPPPAKTKTCYYCGKVMDWDSLCDRCGNNYSFLWHE